MGLGMPETQHAGIPSLSHYTAIKLMQELTKRTIRKKLWHWYDIRKV
jgi:hypothetical protein